MRVLKTLPLPTGLALLATLITGCAGTQPARYADLVSSEQLRANSEDRSERIPYRYRTDTDWTHYRNVIIEPVAVYRGADAQFDELSAADKNELARFMHTTFRQELSKHFWLARRPDPETLRIRLTLTGAEATTPYIAPFLRFDALGAPYNIVQSIRGREGALSGSVMYAVEIHDAHTGDLLYAHVSKQYPNALNLMANLGTLDAAKAGISKGAEELVRDIQ